MKIYSKRFCVECDGERGMYVIRHKNYAMYHCCQCKQEVARVGDLPVAARPKLLTEVSVIRRSNDDFLDGIYPTEAARQNPDMLSDEQGMWPPRDEEAEANREDAMRTLKVAMAGLTVRQRQVLEAVRVHKTQTRAAFALGISQPVVKKNTRVNPEKAHGEGYKTPDKGECMRGYYTPDETEGKFMQTVKAVLLAWCEECGEPIYSNQKHTEQVSDSGNRYFYCPACIVKPETPDEKREEN